jgi:hypothetical protein
MVSAHMPHCRINALGALGGIVAAGFFAYIRGRLASLAHLFFSTALRGNPPLLFYHLHVHHFTLFTHTGMIGIWRCTFRDWPFSSASKPIDLGLGFQVHWVHMQLVSRHR